MWGRNAYSTRPRWQRVNCPVASGRQLESTRAPRQEKSNREIRAEIVRRPVAIVPVVPAHAAPDSDKKTYTEMTKADIERLGTGMTAAMAQVQEQMKNLPSAQTLR